MKKINNGFALAGFIVSACSAPLLAAAFLCLIGVILIPFLSIILGEMAGMLAIFGVCLSAIGVRRSYQPEIRGAGFSLAGLVIGTVVITLVLALTALLIISAVHNLYTPLSKLSLDPVAAALN